MCLALPGKVVSVDSLRQSAKVDLAGVLKEVSIVLVDNIQVGDYLLIHVGFALNKIDPVDAQKTLALFAEAGLVEPVSKGETTL